MNISNSKVSEPSKFVPGRSLEHGYADNLERRQFQETEATIRGSGCWDLRSFPVNSYVANGLGHAAELRTGVLERLQIILVACS
ncbi:hypothetical protein BELL_0143g00010 [Botrytis elliptica]|uniref:Uncharacterized protein n=1 Tax=Botrytis elliptica TaxID=278938 RepID=A0A4Z1JS77_9HELO|nr:hypothetical protein BELL_0143g00010 [Botrytis elliptica]